MQQEVNRLKELRKQAGLTQAELAIALGMPKRTIENYEGHKRAAPDWVYDMIYQQIYSIINAPKKYDRKHGVYSLPQIRMKMFCLAAKYDDIKKITLFGSYAKNRADEKSDLDIVIETERTMFSFYALVDEIEESFGKRIDAFEAMDIIPGEAMDQTIQKEGIVIYER